MSATRFHTHTKLQNKTVMHITVKKSRFSQNAMKRIGFYLVRPQKGQIVLNVWLRRCKWSYKRLIPCVYGRKAEARCLRYCSGLTLEELRNPEKSIVLKRVRIKKHRIQQNQIFWMPVWWHDRLQCWSTQTEGSKYKHNLKNIFEAKFKCSPQTKPQNLYWKHLNTQLIRIAKYDAQSKTVLERQKEAKWD